MPDALPIGPLVVPVIRTSALIALLVGIWLAGRLARRRGLDGDRVTATAEWGALAFVLGARLGFVLDHVGAYAQAPWSAAYLWQPGFDPWVGAAAALLTAGVRLWRVPLPLRQRHGAVLGIGGVMAIAVFAASVGAARVATGDRVRADVGRPLSDIALHDISGREVSLSQLRGSVVVLNLWATWCPPCRREMPALDAVHASYADRGVVVVGVDVGESRRLVRGFLEETPVSYPIWLDPPTASASPSRQLMRELGGIGLPTTAFIDRQGNLASLRVGELNRATLQHELRPLLR